MYVYCHLKLCVPIYQSDSDLREKHSMLEPIVHFKTLTPMYKYPPHWFSKVFQTLSCSSVVYLQNQVKQICQKLPKCFTVLF